MKKAIKVSHVNIRSSISFLLLKLLLVEGLAAIGVVVYFELSLSNFITSAGYEIPLFSMPIYILLVSLKTFVTVWIILQWLNNYYEISPEMIIHRKGLIFRHEVKHPLKHLRNLNVEQTIWGRLLNYGTITLQDPMKLEKMSLYQIHNPLRYAAILEDQFPEEIESIQEVRRHIFDSEKPDISVN